MARRKGETADQYAARRRHEYAENRATVTAQKRANYKRTSTPLKRREHNLRSLYRLSLEEYAVAFKLQDGLCAVCRLPERFENRQLMVDHDHATGARRGLLCGHCNLILGHCKDNAATLREAADYLDSWGKEAVHV